MSGVDQLPIKPTGIMPVVWIVGFLTLKSIHMKITCINVLYIGHIVGTIGLTVTKEVENYDRCANVNPAVSGNARKAKQ